ncbi:RNA-binding domain-containing protein [Backusella circina FSU 941]|nr:RNA-binding domain-containing protein [Backusella circina FSU 941]
MSAPTANIKRLYIGNLDSSIEEYAIVKLFEPFGKITFLDVMVHWSGPKKGLSRGYCFLEYGKREEALAAINALHGKIIKGKPLVVSFAHMTPDQEDARRRNYGVNNIRPNSLTVLRTQKMMHSSTDAKIKAIEKKLQLLNQKQTTSSSTNIPSTIKASTGNSKEQDSKTNARYRPY